MPVSPSQILAALNQKREQFSQFDNALLGNLKRYRHRWEKFAQEPTVVRGSGRLGAQLLESFEGSHKGILPFPQQWPSREASLEWVRSRIVGITTFAVDGSQVFPTKDISIPVALVQVGWFENPHREGGTYDKGARLEVLAPQDLQSGGREEPVDRRVNIRRFELEVERLVEYIQQCPNPAQTLVFFDGALVVTFADAFDEETESAYVTAMVRLLEASDRHRVPLVGYIDTSYARDLVTLLSHLETERGTPPPGLNDAQILHPLMAWGDRTPLFCCDREGILDRYGAFGDQVIFTYLQTSRDRPPARLEFPRWLWEAGQMGAVLDWVRSEVIVGGGYPYAIETADQTAVLQTGDRQLFYRILQDWAEQQQLKLKVSRKLASKLRRR